MHPLYKEAQAIQDKIISHRRHLHEVAEVGFDLPNTLRYVESTLTKLGYEVNPCGKAGLLTSIGAGESAVLLRADMDALPFSEQTNLPYASKNDTMHACGHDMHSSMLLGAAELLRMHEKELQGRVVLMFQPAEEILSGAKDMIENGLLSISKIKKAMMLHVATSAPFATGTVLLSPSGIISPSCDIFTLTVKGKQTHSSMAHLGKDAVLPLCHIIDAWQILETRELPPSEKITLTVGQISGGKAPNILPEHVQVRGTLRVFDKEIRKKIQGRMEGIANNIAAAMECQATLSFDMGCPSFIAEKDLVYEIENTLTPLLTNDFIKRPQDYMASFPLGTGSEDFAYLSHEMPTAMLVLCAGEKQNGYVYPLHHPKVIFDEKALAYGAAVYAHLGLTLER